MGKSEQIHLVLSGDSGCYLCPHLKTALRILAKFSRRQKIPGGYQAAAVAEKPGLSTVKRSPDEFPRDSCDVITVLSANLWHDFPRFRLQVERLERFANLVENVNADILLLQEVARRRGLSADMWLADRLGMSYIYSRVNGHEDIGFEEGLAIFSRFPLIETPLLRQLSQGCNPFVRRLVLGSHIETSCGSLLAFSVHLGLPRKKNAAQLSNLQDWIRLFPLTNPILIGGDFNSPEKRVQIHRAQRDWQDLFRNKNPISDGITHEIHLFGRKKWIRQRLDYIFLRPGQTAWTVIDVNHLESSEGAHSDHKAVVARITPKQ